MVQDFPRSCECFGFQAWEQVGVAEEPEVQQQELRLVFGIEIAREALVYVKVEQDVEGLRRTIWQLQCPLVGFFGVAF